MLAKRLVSGTAWLVGARLIARGLDALSMLIVARLLTPEDFGLVALATALLFILTTITDLSLANPLIQMREPPVEAYHTAFTLNLLRGLILAGVLAAISVPYARIYGDDRLVAIVVALGIAPLLNSLSSPRGADLARDLNFGPIVTREVLARIFSFGVAVGMAYVWQSYWALIVGRLMIPAITTTTSYIVAPYKPGLSLSFWKQLLSFSSWITLSQTMSALSYQADRLLVGGALGPGTLGQYSMGVELGALPTNAPLQPLMRALFSAFSTAAGDIDKLRNYFSQSQQIITFLIVPLGLIVSALADPIVAVTLGPKWLVAADVLRFVAPVFAVQSLAAAADPLIMAVGRTRLLFYREATGLLIRLPLIYAGLQFFGLQGVLWAYAASGGMILLTALYLCKQIVGKRIRYQLLESSRFIVSSLSTYILYYIFSEMLHIVDFTVIEIFIYIFLTSTAMIALYIAIDAVIWCMMGRPIGPESRLLMMAQEAWSRMTRG